MNVINKYVDLKLLSSVGILALVYFITAYLGLSLDPVGGFATLVWAPTGISLAALFLFGSKLWPGVFIGAYVTNMVFSAPPVVALGIAFGNTLESLVGAYLLKSYKLDLKLTKLRDITLFVSFGVVLNTLLAAAIGTITLLIGSIIQVPTSLSVFFAWWVGDALGALIVAPVIFVWSKAKMQHIEPGQRGEFIFWFLFFSLSIFLEFFSSLPEMTEDFFLPYIVVPSIIWLALRFNRQVVASALFILAVAAVAGTVMGSGPFRNEDIFEGLVRAQLFLGIIGLSILIFGAEVDSRRRAEQEILRLNEVLKTRIEEEKRINKLMTEYIKKQTPKVRTSRKSQADLDVN